jgi:hypothetical protein
VTEQRAQAQNALSTAQTMYQSMAMTFWLPETEAALAQVAGRHLVKKERRDHGKLPHIGAEMRALYLVFRRQELAAG